MAQGKVTAGMWRIDPRKISRVIDRCGQPVASVGSSDLYANTTASLIAAAPDMYEMLESLEGDSSIPDDVAEEIHLVLRRARGDFGLAVFSRNAPRIWRARMKDWLKFMNSLWQADPAPEK